MRERRLVFTPYPDWLRMPDPVEHCECCFQPGPDQGLHKHDRTWTLVQFLRVFEQRRRVV